MICGVKKILQSSKLVCGVGAVKRQTTVRLYGNACPALSGNETNSKTISWEDAKPFEDMPGPKSLPVIGNVHRFLPFIGKYN